MQSGRAIPHGSFARCRADRRPHRTRPDIDRHHCDLRLILQRGRRLTRQIFKRRLQADIERRHDVGAVFILGEHRI